MLVRTARPSLSVPFESAILRYMTDEAYDHINGIKRLEGRRERVLYPSTNEGFLKLVRDYGPYMVRGGQLGGRLRTSVVANTSKITSAYSASVALEASYSGSFFVDVDVNATAKAQQASAQSRNHLTLEADPKFKDSDYETTTSQPYVLIADGNTYNLVKINDYMWCRDLYSGTHYQDGTDYRSDLWKNVGGTWHGITGPEYYRVLDYSFHRLMHGGFGVTGWMVPWQDVVQKMIDNLNSVEGTKPDGALDASFRRGGVYGLNSAKPYNSSDNSTWAGFYVVYDGYKNGILVNPEVVYIPVLDSYDREKDNSGKALAEGTDIWTGQTGEVDTKTEDTCTAFAFVNGNASFVHFWDQAPTANTFDAAQWNKYRNRNTPIDYLKNDLSGDRVGNHVFYPVFLTQQIIK